MRRRAAILIPGLLLITLASWWWITVMALDMYGPMTGASAWMMKPHWGAFHLLLLWAMWAVMMTAMMLPSATPMILLGGSAGQGYLLALGYVVVWAGFSVGATALQWALRQLLVLTPMMEPSSRLTGAVLVGLAGVYQFTPLKHACLRTCQSPMTFLAQHWRSGRWGAFRMGVEHGVYCVGCCWALMLVLFAGGVMNLTVILALTLLVAVEKLAPVGLQSARVSGALLVVAAVWMLVR
jgi:predicted metal-binding membrane protein